MNLLKLRLKIIQIYYIAKYNINGSLLSFETFSNNIFICNLTETDIIDFTKFSFPFKRNCYINK